ncbi:MAG: YCF48-related protein [Candidatus Thermoplasmatota archaeon]|nr:YCF48-related protein [Candidatus Thermoplasmatota archaeon]
MRELAPLSVRNQPVRVNRVVSVVALLVIVGLVGNSQAADYKSGWYVGESGSELNLNSAESFDEQIWVFGDSGLILISSDFGQTWTPTASPISEDIHYSDSAFGALAIAGNSGILLLKQDVNSDWVELPLSESINGISLTGNNSLVAVGNEGAIWRYGGSNWEFIPTGVDEDLLDVSFLDEDLGVAVGKNGTIIFSEDGGQTWDYRDAPSEVIESPIVSVEFFSPVRIYAVTDQGHIIKSAREGTTDVGFLWNLVEIERHYPPGTNEFVGRLTSLGVTIHSIDVVSTNKFLLVGAGGYVSMSNDGGNIVRQQINPAGNNTSLYEIAMIDGFDGIVIGEQGLVLWTDRAGEDEPVGFEVINFNDFDNFVDYSKDMLFAGFIATIKIVVFGIVMGFLFGVTLAMCKTSPTSMKYMVERFDPKMVRVVGILLAIGGLYQFYIAVPKIADLGLDGIENIFIPVGDPGSFGRVLLGIGLTFVGVLFMTHDGKFSKLDLKGFKLNPWGVRPLNTIATLYTDFFRNTPLIVQFMFIHFGLQLGRLIQEPAQAFLEDSTGGVAQFIKDEFLNDRAYISAICALGFNSGAYQCETIRGAIQAIPSAQMEAGRSIGLTYLQTMRRVIMPQAIRICIPPMGNEMVNLVLNSSLAMVIGYAELTRQGKLITAVTFQMAYTWGMVLVSYFVITWTLALILRRLEESTRIPGLGMTGGE